MAGGVLKGVGSLLLVLGILLVLAGLGVVGYAMLDERENADAGPLGVGRDPERSDQNEALVVGGAAAAGAGLVALVAAVLFLVGGGARRDAALRRDLAAGGAVSSGDGRGAGARTAWDAEFGGAAAGGGDGATATAAAGIGGDPASSGRGVQAGLWAAGAAAAIALVGVLAYLVMDGEGVLGGGGERLLEQDTLEGSVPPSLVVGGMVQSLQPSTVSFATPDGARRLQVVVAWQPRDGGAERLDVRVELRTDDGWVELASASGGSGLAVAAQDGRLSGAALRLRVQPADDGAYAEQPYAATLLVYG